MATCYGWSLGSWMPTGSRRSSSRDGSYGRPAMSEAAASRLEEALALWRGPALADLAYEEAAREEIARLDELRIAAVEERIDADLDCGRHAELIPELQGLVGQHPSRERLRGQLMLALYRSGRQAEAVNAYADARRALSEELGIEPGAELRDLERRVLAHDPTLAPPRRARLAAAGDGLRRRWLLLAGAALLLAAAVAAAAVELTSGGTQAGIANLAGDSVGLIDPASGRIVGQFPVGTAPTQVVADTTAAWTLNVNDATIARADLTTGASRRTGIGATPVALALGAGSVWVSYATSGGEGPYGVVRLDPDTLLPRGRTVLKASQLEWTAPPDHHDHGRGVDRGAGAPGQDRPCERTGDADSAAFCSQARQRHPGWAGRAPRRDLGTDGHRVDRAHR